ncbi:aminoglycoside phosphotransferase family protein [Cohnella abietis]|uniref:Aminoglycoside phosphotransferase domain-containing protein n=1 Tax=Cohnella abietis TaxID=2507935 RepID=A0A3T1CYH3_9BACL|nr:hypothetical protein [Cohnella abietis]BBI30903.1 hypothetical protein KCTCHS21_03020 [Cohnella abietis]
MSRDNFLRSILSEKVNMTPDGFVADQLTPQQFWDCHELFFDKILEIHSSDISGIEGYGNFNEECRTGNATYRDYLIDDFADDKEGYWYNWREMFDTTLLKREFFEQYYKEIEDRIPYCEDKRYLVNNFMFFTNMITDGNIMVGFPDWTFAGIGDFLTDIAIMDLNKPYMRIPELFVPYCKKRGIDIPDFKERFLCVAYWNGLNGLRWHASIDDEESCTSIIKSVSELKDRIYAL